MGFKGKCFVMFFLLFMGGCGYQWTGKKTHVPTGLKSLAIPTFMNQTFEPGIEIPFTQAFLNDFIQDQRVKVVSRAEADSVLEGVIKSFHIASVSYNPSGFVKEYQATVKIDLTLKNRGGEILWKENNLSETQWYSVTSGTITTEASKANAVREVGKLAAERVRNRFFHNF